MRTYAYGKLFRYLHFELLHRHALHLLPSIAEVDGHFLPLESKHHNLVYFAHFSGVSLLCVGYSAAFSLRFCPSLAFRSRRVWSNCFRVAGW